jgi:DNA repair ATPase RecN
MFVSLPEYTQRLRIDLRRKTVHNETLKRVHLDHKKKIEELIQKNKQLTEELEKFKKENEKLKQTIEKLTKTNERFGQVSTKLDTYSH